MTDEQIERKRLKLVRNGWIRCEFCTYWDPWDLSDDEQPRGLCRKDPPQDRRQPITFADDYCSHGMSAFENPF